MNKVGRACEGVNKQSCVLVNLGKGVNRASRHLVQKPFRAAALTPPHITLPSDPLHTLPLHPAFHPVHTLFTPFPPSHLHTPFTPAPGCPH